MTIQLKMTEYSPVSHHLHHLKHVVEQYSSPPCSLQSVYISKKKKKKISTDKRSCYIITFKSLESERYFIFLCFLKVDLFSPWQHLFYQKCIVKQ